MPNGFCEYIFHNGDTPISDDFLKIFGNMGYSCINPNFGKVYVHINDSFDSIECSDKNEADMLLSGADRGGLTFWKGNDDIYADFEIKESFDVLTIALDGHTDEENKNNIAALLREIMSGSYSRKISKIVIDRSDTVETAAYLNNDPYCLELFGKYEKYGLDLAKTYLINFETDTDIIIGNLSDTVYTVGLDGCEGAASVRKYIRR